MANISVLNMEGKEVGSIELNDAVFGVEVKEHLMHKAVVLQLANNRQGEESLGDRRERVTQDRVPSERLSGKAAVSYLRLSREITLLR